MSAAVESVESALEVADPSENLGPRSPRRLSDAEAAEFRVRAARGATIASLSRESGFSENAVRRAVRGRRGNLGGSRKNLPSETAVLGRGESGRPPRLSDDAVRAILQDKGTSARDVAARHGVSRRHVLRIWAGEARLAVIG